uniref:Zonadhesin n=2 Tax=Bactrocera latifrons TaxID=174628 RepID=A0A0K8WLA3_BACLA
MITDRNKFNFVTICIGLGFLLTSTSVASAQATSNAQQETNQQQQLQTPEQNQPAIATITVVDNNKDEKTNAILNEPINDVAHAFSPRLDYSNEWRPVGRGDPLKNDPTFDYSPPTLEHVRYWAETTTKDGGNSKEENDSGKQDISSVRFAAHPGQQDIPKYGMPNEHLRGSNGVIPASSHAPQQHAHMNQHVVMPHQHYHQSHHPGAVKNAKGEIPLVQPKYTSVRRSYYAQQPPTRLMPPPIQLNSPPINTFNVPMKPSQVHTEYRHSMSAAPPPHTSTMSSMGPSSSSLSPLAIQHMKMQHQPSMSTTASSSSWMYHAPPTMHHHQQQPQHHQYAMPSGSAAAISTAAQSSRMPVSHIYDSHPQDSHYYFSYARPSANSITSHPPQESYSANSVRHSPNSLKQSGTGRKPWLHELLQKEVVKTSAKPNYSTSANKYAYDTTKPIYERMPSTNAISGGFTPITPITHVSAPPTVATTTTTTTTAPRVSSTASPIAITPSVFYPTIGPTLTPHTPSTTTYVIYTTPTTTTTPRTTTSTTSSRLLIPTTSNLASRPTVAPMQMTTDSLFSHYKQPEAPLRGPMYLIIEGHSKVKKYGKNGINLNLPKIVPVIPKREPVVRVAEPGEEKRGTPETFHVEHLHVKTSSTTTTTTTAKPSTTPKSVTTAKPSTTTTAKPTKAAPIMKSTPTTSKPVVTTKPNTTANSAKSTTKPVTSTTTTARPTATTVSSKVISTTAAAVTTKATTKSTVKSEDFQATSTPAVAKLTQSEPLLKLELPNEPPPGMSGLLSLLDSSLGGLFAEQPLDSIEMPASPMQAKQTASTKLAVMNSPNTVLKAVNTATPATIAAQSAVVPVVPDARIGTNAADTFASGSAEFSFTTDMPPREVRQVFDYDQRPESRLKDFVIERFDGDATDDEGASSAFYDDEFEEYEEEDANNSANGDLPIKRMDRFVDGEEGEFVGDYEDVDLEELGMSDVAPSSILVRTQAKMA